MRILPLLTLLFLLGCGQSKKKEKQLPFFCENELQLFDSDSRLTEIRINYGKDSNLILTTATDKAHYKNGFYLHLNNKRQPSPFKIKVYEPQWKELTSCGIHRRLQILFNRNNDVLVNHIANLNADSILPQMEKFLFDSSYKDYNIEISLTWETSADKKLLMEVINIITSSYIELANKVSFEMFHLKVCELNSSQIRELREVIPFNLILEPYWPIEVKGNAG